MTDDLIAIVAHLAEQNNKLTDYLRGLALTTPHKWLKKEIEEVLDEPEG